METHFYHKPLPSDNSIFKNNFNGSNPSTSLDDSHYDDDWEIILNENNMTVLRQQIDQGDQYKYKVHGTFDDIPAWAFYKAQVDTEYRKKWDKYVLNLDMLQRNPKMDCEVIRWVVCFPYPMYDREYIFVRRHKFDPSKNVIAVLSRSIPYPTPPIDKKFVRVDRYSSNLFIKPHETIEKNGFDFVLEYNDDPQSMFPNTVYSWVTKSGIVDFLNRLHDAAKELCQSDPCISKPSECIKMPKEDIRISTSNLLNDSRELPSRSFS
ncbi:unnamed protein product [Gordionus sp. m RMFG-2023]